MQDPRQANLESRDAWNQNAGFWDSRMGEGNDFVEVLLWPATARLLAVQPGQQVLDIACGNGLTSRRLAAMGAEVIAFDFAEEMVLCARQRTTEHLDTISYRVLDATNESELLDLGQDRFDAALCQMALFDMAEIEPLLRALPRLLRPQSRFVFSVIHPCFNGPHMTHVAERVDRAGELITDYAVKIFRYITPMTAYGAAIGGQPKPQLYFHRPLEKLLGVAFRAGFVLDALEEPSFPPEHPHSSSPLTWGGNYSEIPPVLVARLRPAR